MENSPDQDQSIHINEQNASDEGQKKVPPGAPERTPIKEPGRQQPPKGDPLSEEEQEPRLSEFDEAQYYNDERADVGGVDLDI
jgi:hypothetical protein